MIRPGDKDRAGSDGVLDELCRQAVTRFADLYSASPQCVIVAPGRVNLIGEHTDSNDGFVFPMAIERYVVIAAAP